MSVRVWDFALSERRIPPAASVAPHALPATCTASKKKKEIEKKTKRNTHPLFSRLLRADGAAHIVTCRRRYCDATKAIL
eukprot:3167496-Rhodomonas_salina.1